jgi:hypothetical protein
LRLAIICQVCHFVKTGFLGLREAEFWKIGDSRKFSGFMACRRDFDKVTILTNSGGR